MFRTALSTLPAVARTQTPSSLLPDSRYHPFFSRHAPSSLLTLKGLVSRPFCSESTAKLIHTVSSGSLIPDFSVLASVNCLVLDDPILIRLKQGCIPPNVKELKASLFGFDAETVKGLTHLHVDRLDDDMEIPPTLENLFIGELNGKFVPKVGTVFLAASEYEEIEQSNAGDHYLFQEGMEDIDENMLVSDKYVACGPQHLMGVCGEVYRVIKRALKTPTPEPAIKYTIIGKHDDRPRAPDANTCLHAVWHEEIDESNIGDHHLYYYRDSPIPDSNLVSKKYKTVGDQHVVEVDGKTYTIIKRIRKDETDIARDAIAARLNELTTQVGKLQEELKGLSKE